MRSGQFFVLRFLTRDGWWRAHPYSISSAPNGRWLRFTVKDLGDDSGRMRHLAVGTRVFIEGPYGVLTGARRTRRGVTLIAGGIGITPLRALLESLPAQPGDLTLIYRAAHQRHLVFRDELETLAALRGARVHYLVGSRRKSGHGAQLPAPTLDRETISRLVPSIADQDVYVCGPTGMMRTVEAALADLGVPRRQVHSERFAY